MDYECVLRGLAPDLALEVFHDKRIGSESCPKNVSAGISLGLQL